MIAQMRPSTEVQSKRFAVDLEKVSEFLDLNEGRGFESNLFVLPHEHQ